MRLNVTGKVHFNKVNVKPAADKNISYSNMA